jgi:hypothetical protein
MAREYNISKTACLCRSCQKRLEPGSELVATVREVGEELQRQDFCPDCWSARSPQDQAEPLGVWHGRVPMLAEKKKLLVDDELLVNLFQRLDGADTPAKVNFRFVLALILMRKKLLVYDRTEQLDGLETWVMHLRGDPTPVKVVNPHLDDGKVAEVSGQLGQIMEGEL